jgi:hypothetical protein
MDWFPGMDLRRSSSTAALVGDGEDSYRFSIYHIQLRERPQRVNHFANLVLLEQADTGDPGCAGLETDAGVFHGDTAQRKHWNLLLASLLQCFYASSTTS